MILRRVCACGIDFVLAGLIAGVLFLVFLLFGLLTLGLGMGLLGLIPAVPAAYHVLFLLSPLSATPGQRMLGLVVRRDDDLGPPTLVTGGRDHSRTDGDADDRRDLAGRRVVHRASTDVTRYDRRTGGGERPGTRAGGH